MEILCLFFYDHAVCACNRLFKNKVIFLPVSDLILLFSADGQQQCAGEDACQIEISETWTSLSPTQKEIQFSVMMIMQVKL